MTTAKLTISSKNYSSWSLRGWLLCKLAKIDFVEEVLPGLSQTFSERAIIH